MEEWKDIEGYEGLYQISSEGRVKSLERFRKGKHNSLVFVNEKILKGVKDKDDYLKVILYKEGKVKTHKIHRLVASAFLPNPDNLLEINHIDENKQNNCLDNLEFCDRSYNINFGSRTERMAKSHSKPVLQFTKEMEFVRKWESGTQVQRELGFYGTSITKCCKGKLKSAYGFVWGYEKDYERIQFKVFDIEMYKKIA